MSDTDPFTQVIERLWDLIEADGELAGLVKPGNRIKLTGDGQIPMKASVQDGDMPELAIEPVGGSLNPHYTSTSLSVTQLYRFSLVTGNLMVDAVLFPVKWALLKLLVRICGNQLEELPFVTNADLIGEAIEEGFDRAQEKNRGTSGWALGLTLSVAMTFNRSANIVQNP